MFDMGQPDDTRYYAPIWWWRLRHGRNLSPNLRAAFNAYDVVKYQVSTFNARDEMQVRASLISPIEPVPVAPVAFTTRDWRVRVDIHSASQPSKATCDMVIQHTRRTESGFNRGQLKFTFANQNIIGRQIEGFRLNMNSVWEDKAVFTPASVKVTDIADWVNHWSAERKARFAVPTLGVAA